VRPKPLKHSALDFFSFLVVVARTMWSLFQLSIFGGICYLLLPYQDDPGGGRGTAIIAYAVTFGVSWVLVRGIDRVRYWRPPPPPPAPRGFVLPPMFDRQ
jgi:hypothetical protein